MTKQLDDAETSHYAFEIGGLFEPIRMCSWGGVLCYIAVAGNYECVVAVQNISRCFSTKICYEFVVMDHAAVVVQEV